METSQKQSIDIMGDKVIRNYKLIFIVSVCTLSNVFWFRSVGESLSVRSSLLFLVTFLAYSALFMYLIYQSFFGRIRELKKKSNVLLIPFITIVISFFISVMSMII
jgi:hypothetical protein